MQSTGKGSTTFGNKVEVSFQEVVMQLYKWTLVVQEKKLKKKKTGLSDNCVKVLPPGLELAGKHVEHQLCCPHSHPSCVTEIRPAFFFLGPSHRRQLGIPLVPFFHPSHLKCDDDDFDVLSHLLNERVKWKGAFSEFMLRMTLPPHLETGNWGVSEHGFITLAQQKPVFKSSLDYKSHVHTRMWCETK